jgi:hypothetical protein
MVDARLIAPLIAPIRKTTGRASGETKSPLYHRKQHVATVRRQAAAVKSAVTFLRAMAGNENERIAVLFMAGAADTKCAKGWRKHPKPKLYQRTTPRSPASKQKDGPVPIARITSHGVQAAVASTDGR